MTLILGYLLLFSLYSFVSALWPRPQYFQHGSSTLWLSPQVEIVYKTFQEPYGFWNTIQKAILPKRKVSSFMDPLRFAGAAFGEEPIFPRAVLQLAFGRMKKSLFSERFEPHKFHPRSAVFEPNVNDKKYYAHTIIVQETKSIKQQRKLYSSSEEAYSLSVSEDGLIVIEAICIQGALHALQTLSQLFYAHSNRIGEVYTVLAPLAIIDGPAFGHRGLNLDISRNWISPQDVMRTIEAMGFNKLNRLHIHASDSQSWPLEIPALPDLALKGAYHASQIWTTADLREVQRYGLHHGVEVYLEIDLPGHTASIAHAYPELITAGNQQPWSSFAVEPPAGQLKLNSSQVFSFLTTLLNDLLPRSSQYSSIFHIGGDELDIRAYKLDPTVNSSSIDILKPLLQVFSDHVFYLTTSHSMTPLVWEEMVLEWNLTLPKSTVVQTWRSTTSLASVVARGHKALFGSNSHWYLDCGHGTFLDPDTSKSVSPIKPPYLDYCSPYKNWRQIYSYDPLVDIPNSRRHLVVGGEVHLWGELTDSVNLDSVLWPRAAAAAEVLWSGTGTTVDEGTTRRLAEMRERLVVKGIAAGMVQMEWCLRNKGQCSL